jgi:hypothetical protein
MSIVKYKNQSGITYAYESTSSYDPETKQSRPKRKYLGRVDEETGEIIPTRGKRGRPRKNATEDKDIQEPKDYKRLYEKKCKELEKVQEELLLSNIKITALTEQIGELKKILSLIREQTLLSEKIR